MPTIENEVEIEQVNLILSKLRCSYTVKATASKHMNRTGKQCFLLCGQKSVIPIPEPYEKFREKS